MPERTAFATRRAANRRLGILCMASACLFACDGGADTASAGDAQSGLAEARASVETSTSSDGSARPDAPDAPASAVQTCSGLPARGTWQNITPPGVVWAGAVSLDPFDIGTLWLGTNPNGTSTHGLGGIFKSTDCGTTWTHVSTGVNGAAVDSCAIWSMAVDYIDPGVLYVEGQYGAEGLWKSTNGGVDWTQLMPPGGNVAMAENVSAGSPPEIGSVSMDPKNHLHLMAGAHLSCVAPHYPLCEFETTDGGATWSVIDVKIPGATGWIEAAGPYVIDDKTSLFATGFNGLWLTTDDGQTWQNVTPPEVIGASGGEYTDRPFTPSPSGTYYLPGFGNSNGLLESSDGLSWSWVMGSPHGSYDLGLAMGNGRLYLGDFEGVTYATASEKNPTEWMTLTPPPIPSGGQGPETLQYDEAHGVLYSGNFNSGLWRVVTP